jgi:hypothetical protein
MDWFESLTGFKELGYEETRRSLEVVGQRLRSKVNERSYGVGMLETPSLAELRVRAAKVIGNLAGRVVVTNISGDVRRMHAEPESANALFQVASQFNLLEMTGPEITPEHGVTRYEHDHTQGPACAIAAGAATIYRNYFAVLDGEVGQTRQRQFDCLHDIGVALGNHDGSLWRMRNGYALCSEHGLARIDRHLSELDHQQLDDLRGNLRIGLHWNVEVTVARELGQHVTQAFCSALPVTYTHIPQPKWQSFALLVLEGAYEATLWAAALNAAQGSSRTVLLTRLGGGAFGNKTSWIDAAMRRALDKIRNLGLDVRIVSRGAPDRELVRLADEFRQT